MIDSALGLRVWDLNQIYSKGANSSMIASIPLPRSSDDPTALCFDTSLQSSILFARVAVGFASGMLVLYGLRQQSAKWQLEVQYMGMTNVVVHQMAFRFPYVIALTEISTGSHQIKCFKFPESHPSEIYLPDPILIKSLDAYAFLSPCSLSIRPKSESPKRMVASIAYTVKLLQQGYTVGIQEFDLESPSSRVAHCIPLTYRGGSLLATDGFATTTTLSYAHPYLLTAHVDNTLTLYMVRSTAERLCITKPRRLWGHTSKVSKINVADRGRAVSVSGVSGELRVWELEGSAMGESIVLPGFVQGVRVQERLEYERITKEPITDVDYLGFDDTRVCVVRNEITVYDFN